MPEPLAFVYDPQATPESQHHLTRIPPSARVDHPKLKAALERYETARKEEHAKRLDFNQGELELPAAQYRDEQALATAKSAKKADPGPVEEEKQLALIRECRRQHGASKILLQQAIEGVNTAFSEYGDEWEAALVKERDQLRSTMSELLDGWERLWSQLQVNTANRALLAGTGTPQANTSVYASSFRAPRVVDGSVVQVADVLEGLRSLAAPEPAKDNVVENVPVGQTPPSKQPFAGLGSQQVPLGRRVAPEAVRKFQERDEAEARARAVGLSDERRQERMARAGQRRVDREIMADVDREAAEAVQ